MYIGYPLSDRGFQYTDRGVLALNKQHNISNKFDKQHSMINEYHSINR